ncbi:MAG: DNA repair protein RecN [Bacteroidales bacterium]|nr:DNA repair protein RecN [Bacteroidales bacterium]
MLQHLRIENYVLIRSLDVDMDSGFCVITGETGAGKSILLGALGLVLGQRADSGILSDSGKKCVIEAHFNIENLDLSGFFAQNDLDSDASDSLLILRREVLPGGKSRAFVNDTPVLLPVLRELAFLLIDIHSQHETLTLGRAGFQLQLLDSYMEDASDLLSEYAGLYRRYKELHRQIERQKEEQAQSAREQDYWQFLFDELDKLNLQAGEQKQMEDTLERLSHAELLQTTLAAAVAETDGEEMSLRSRVDNLLRSLKKIAPYHKGGEASLPRWQSLSAELADLGADLNRWSEEDGTDSDVKTRYEERLDALYRLERKHKVENDAGLIALRDDLARKLGKINGSEEELAAKEAELASYVSRLEQMCAQLHAKRGAAAQSLQTAIVSALADLGMEQSRLEIRLSDTAQFTATGSDKVEFLFTANLGSEPKEISKVASGGELSRLMLAIKSVIHRRNLLGTIIFDEIDTGVSGKIAGKVAAMMQRMSRYMQVIAISHLPQIAAKAGTHFHVYKAEEDGRTVSCIRRLNQEEHIASIASMLSNEQVTEAALQAARELIKG